MIFLLPTFFISLKAFIYFLFLGKIEACQKADEKIEACQKADEFCRTGTLNRGGMSECVCAFVSGSVGFLSVCTRACTCMCGCVLFFFFFLLVLVCFGRVGWGGEVLVSRKKVNK